MVRLGCSHDESLQVVRPNTAFADVVDMILKCVGIRRTPFSGFLAVPKQAELLQMLRQVNVSKGTNLSGCVRLTTLLRADRVHSLSKADVKAAALALVRNTL